MKRITFRELSLAFNWMVDNAVGHAFVFNLKRTEIIIVRHKETAKQLHAKCNEQTDDFEQIRQARKRYDERLCGWW